MPSPSIEVVERNKQSFPSLTHIPDEVREHYLAKGLWVSLQAANTVVFASVAPYGFRAVQWRDVVETDIEDACKERFTQEHTDDRLYSGDLILAVQPLVKREEMLARTEARRVMMEDPEREIESFRDDLERIAPDSPRVRDGRGLLSNIAVPPVSSHISNETGSRRPDTPTVDPVAELVRRAKKR